MRGAWLKTQLCCLVLFTPVLSMAAPDTHLSISEPITQYVWDEAYKPFVDPQNTYGTQFLTSDYNAFWPDPTSVLRADLYLNPDSAYAKSMLDIVYFPDSESSTSTPKKNRPPIAEYSLHWPVMVHNYYLFTGNEEHVRALAVDILPEVTQYFEDRMTQRGLLRSPATWPASLRAGIDYPSMAKTEDAITNAFYYRAIVACEALYRDLGMDATEWRTKAHALKTVYHEAFAHDNQRLFVDSVDSQNISVTTNALALCFGLTPPSAHSTTIELIRKYGMSCAPSMVPYVVEACFIGQEPRLAIDLLSFMHDFNQNPEPLYLIPQYVLGMYPESAGWSTVGITPRVPSYMESASLRIPVPTGRVSIDYVSSNGMNVTVPLESRVIVDSVEGMNVMVKKYKSHSNETTLTPEQQATLNQANRVGWAGDEPMLWVDVDTQMLRIIEGDRILYQARCASASNGVGAQKNSLQTPLGWHSIHQKLGDDAPWGQVFRSRRATPEIWLPGKDTTEDLVLTRVILLTGEEPDVNQGGNVDSLERHIYIHGTNDEARIGMPSSHGCIRMTNDDVIDLYTLVEPAMKVLITASDAQ